MSLNISNARHYYGCWDGAKNKKYKGLAQTAREKCQLVACCGPLVAFSSVVAIQVLWLQPCLNISDQAWESRRGCSRKMGRSFAH